MADYLEPTKTDFNNAEQAAIDVVSVACPDIMTKTGSVVRELVIRPLAYLFSWLVRNTDNDLNQYSVAYLKTSQLTENPVADAVASNYFVERREGTYAKGVVTLILTQPNLRISEGSRFVVGDVMTHTTVQYMVTNQNMTSSTEGLVYLRSLRDGDNWAVNVPVEAVDPGRQEVPVGAEVSVGFGCNILEAAELTSPLTGGSSVETDAELMTRAEYNTAESGIGTYYGLKKKFDGAPSKVYDLMAVAGEDVPLFRARYNNVNINPGGYVDCYVKTSNQAMTATVPNIVCTLDAGTGLYTGYVESPDPTLKYAAPIRVNFVLTDGGEYVPFDVTFEAIDDTLPASGARLSVKQKTVISFAASELYDISTDTPPQTVVVAAGITYMPAITDLQKYLDGDNETFIGQDVMVKAAIPVQVSIDFALHPANELTDEDIQKIQEAVMDYVNNIQVGTPTLNFSDIRNACMSVMDGIEPRLPCTMSATTYLQDGSLTSFHSNTGILDIRDPSENGSWNHKMCFFSTCTDLVRIAIV